MSFFHGGLRKSLRQQLRGDGDAAHPAVSEEAGLVIPGLAQPSNVDLHGEIQPQDPLDPLGNPGGGPDGAPALSGLQPLSS